MSKKAKFSDEEEEQIIDFVKNHDILYNVRGKSFRDSEAKNRLWLQLGQQLGKEGRCDHFIYCEYIIIITVYIIVHTENCSATPCGLANLQFPFH